MMAESDCDWRGLSDEQLAQYAAQGYLHLRGLFNEPEIDLGLEIIDRAVRAQAADAGASVAYHTSYLNEGNRPDLERVRNAIAQQRALAYFLDHPRLVGPMVSLLGPQLHVLGTEAFYRDVGPARHEPWHMDAGSAMQGVKIDHAGLDLQVKAQIFLTEVSGPRSGNFLLIPGSHTRPATAASYCLLAELNERLLAGCLPEEALTVCAKPGDVLLFPYSLWHAVDFNDRALRKTFILRFGQLWHRPHDYLAQPREVLEGLSPRLRRMFGDFGSAPHPMDYYKPAGQEAVMRRGGDYTSLVPAALLERHGLAAYRPVSWSNAPYVTDSA
jgi:ectoine hydroxylase-related dioxygenase (phytanoyl-CoA dioxygenase family)